MSNREESNPLLEVGWMRREDGTLSHYYLCRRHGRLLKSLCGRMTTNEGMVADARDLCGLCFIINKRRLGEPRSKLHGVKIFD